MTKQLFSSNRLILAIILAVLLLFVTASPQVRGRQNGKIAFVSDRDGNREIYVMNADGTNQVRLTTRPEADDCPVWSPDGRKIAFVGGKVNGGSSIYVMNSDGTNRSAIIDLNESLFATWSQLSWSPDGRMIAFHDSSGPSTGIDIFIVNADGSGRRKLTADHAHWDLFPTWSPDGSKILFSRYDFYPQPGYGGTMLHSINADGTNLNRLKNGFLDGWNEDEAKWSAAANKIVYTVNVWDFYRSLYIADPDGENRQLFEQQPGLDIGSPSWSPDGRKIVFSRHETFGTYAEICVKEVSNGGITVLTTAAQGNNYSPSWQALPRILPGSGQGEGRMNE